MNLLNDWQTLLPDLVTRPVRTPLAPGMAALTLGRPLVEVRNLVLGSLAAGPCAPQGFNGEVFKAFTQLVRSLIDVGDDHFDGLSNSDSVGGAYPEVSFREVKDHCDRAETVPLPNIVFIVVR